MLYYHFGGSFSRIESLCLVSYPQTGIIEIFLLLIFLSYCYNFFVFPSTYSVFPWSHSYLLVIECFNHLDFWSYLRTQLQIWPQSEASTGLFVCTFYGTNLTLFACYSSASFSNFDRLKLIPEYAYPTGCWNPNCSNFERSLSLKASDYSSLPCHCCRWESWPSVSQAQSTFACSHRSSSRRLVLWK